MPKCLLISNRLPVNYDSKKHEFRPSAGGLVSAIQGLDCEKINYKFTWMGVMTNDVPSDMLKEFCTTNKSEISYHPVIADKDVYTCYYNGFCNNVLWPLLHYERSVVQEDEKSWKCYKEINELIAKEVLETTEDGDSVWIHDFHLMLVPGLVKEKRPSLKVGFFLHTPFPSSEIFRELPQRKEILKSLVNCDLIGFHDLSYLNHFKSSVSRILGEGVVFKDKQGGVFPISIDTKHFMDLANQVETIKYREKYSTIKQDKKWILGVDRLDYIKGLVLKLKAFQYFMRAYPDLRNTVEMVQVVIPSRTEVPEYQSLKQKVEQLVSSINGEFGSPGHTPVQYLYHSVTEHELSALYQLSDVLHVSSRRDGMNLVAMEYVVSQSQESPGVLLLSEFTGAHSTLSHALSINPWDIPDTARKMQEALERPIEFNHNEMDVMQTFLRSYTSTEWAELFLSELEKAKIMQEPLESASTDNSDFSWIDGLKGKNVLFFCDFDGTLAPITLLPSQADLTNQTRSLLKKLQGKNKLELVIVSGRDKPYLQKKITEQGLSFGLAACHGAYSYQPKDKKWVDLANSDSMSWKQNVLEILKMYTDRTPGSFIEDKGHAVTWHFRNSPEKFAEFVSNKMCKELEESLSSSPTVIVRGKKIIEVKSLHASKGIFVSRYLERRQALPDVVISLGDDTTDEDMFKSLLTTQGIENYSIKVGKGQTAAKYCLPAQMNVDAFLTRLADSI